MSYKDDPDYHKMVVERADNLKAFSGYKNTVAAEREAENDIARWYDEASELQGTIRRVGLIKLLSYYQLPRIWITLYYFKDVGIHDLPL